MPPTKLPSQKYMEMGMEEKKKPEEYGMALGYKANTYIESKNIPSPRIYRKFKKHEAEKRMQRERIRSPNKFVQFLGFFPCPYCKSKKYFQK
jgi:hypothetical protein